MLIRTFALATVAALTLAVGAAFACSCVRYNSAQEQLERSSVAFIGRVASTTAGENTDSRMTRFTVEKTLKGSPQTSRTVRHSIQTGGMCGVTFQSGRSYLILAREHEGRLVTSSCSMPQFPQADFEAAAARQPG